MSHRNKFATGLRRGGLLLAVFALSLPGLAAGPQTVSPANAARIAPRDAKNGLFVAVGYGGRRMRSRDGVTWEQDVEWAADGGDDNNCLFGVAFGKGRFVAVGGGASEGHVFVTRDGKAWKETFKAKTRIVPILWGNNRFVVGSGRDFLWSADGETWTVGGKVTYDRGLYFRRGAFGNGVFVFCGDVDIADGQPRGGWRAATKDGVTIEAFASDLPNTRSVAFGAGRFVMVGEKGYRGVSTDGKAWTTATDPSEDFHWVFWTGKQFLLGGNAVYASPDGLTWTKTDKSVPCEPQCVSPKGMAGVSWKTSLWRSEDGLAWQRVSQTGTNAFTSVAYGAPSAPAIKDGK